MKKLLAMIMNCAILFGMMGGLFLIAEANGTTYTTFSSCDTNWTHFELETSNFREGTGATGITLDPNQIRPLQTGNGADRFMQITSQNINLTDATGGLGMWVWIDNDVIFDFGDIQLSSSEISDSDAYSWNMDQWKNRLSPGWTWLTLKFSDAQKLGNPNPNSLNFMRLFIAHNSAVAKRFLIDDMRIINVTEASNLIAPKQVTTFNNCNTNWTHFELETTNFREGSGATGITLDPNQIRPLQSGNGADRFMQITSENINLTDATGGLGMWVWIDSNVVFNFGDIQLSSSENSDSDAYYWNMSQWKDRLTPGWTWLTLKFSEAQKLGNPNPNSLNFMRLFIAHNSLSAKRFLIDDMRLINVKEPSNLIAPRQVTAFNNCETNWTHFEFETTNFREGTGATGITLDPNQIRPLESGNGSNKYMQITSENINLTDSTGGLGMWVWIDNDVVFSFGDIQLSSSEISDSDAYSWSIGLWKDRLKPGWTWLTLKFSDAQKLGNPNPNNLNFMRLFISHNSVSAKRFLIDDMRIINVKEPSNIIAPTQATTFNDCDTNWTHFELETTNFKEGAGATGITLDPNQIRPLESGSGSNKYMQITSENINLTDATGALGLWIWIENEVSFNFGDIQLTSSKGSDTDAYVWNMNEWKDRLNPGWTWLTLKFSDAQKLGNPNPNALDFMRIFICHNSLAAKRFLFDDIRLMSVKNIYNLSTPSYNEPVIFGNNNLNGSILTKIQPNSTVADFLSGITIRSDITISFKNENTTLFENAKIGTGTKAEVFTNETLTATYSLVIYGDVDGDGEISINDLSAVKLHLLKSSLLISNFLTAADTSKNGSVTVSDLIAVKKQILNLVPISQG